MAEERELVVLVTRGTDHELSSVAFTIANGGITAGLKVAIFLTSAAVDLVRSPSKRFEMLSWFVCHSSPYTPHSMQGTPSSTQRRASHCLGYKAIPD